MSKVISAMQISVKKLNPKAVIPQQMHPGDAGVDLCACVNSLVVIPPQSNVLIPTGLAIAVPEGYFGAIYPRSGLASKKGLRPANCVGVCDSQYRGEYMVALYNDSSEPQLVKPGERIAQLVIQPCMYVNFEEVDELDETERGTGGFGSTGE